MSNTQVRSETAIETPRAQRVDMKLEVVVIAVSDVDRAKRFYENLGWRLDADFAMSGQFRIVQFTPPGSPCSIQFGTVTSAAPGSAKVLYLVVSDIEAARAELVDRGVEVSEPFHRGGSEGRLSGPDPQRRSYASYASVAPHGIQYLGQEAASDEPERGIVPPVGDFHNLAREGERRQTWANFDFRVKSSTTGQRTLHDGNWRIEVKGNRQFYMPASGRQIASRQGSRDKATPHPSARTVQTGCRARLNTNQVRANLAAVRLAEGAPAETMMASDLSRF